MRSGTSRRAGVWSAISSRLLSELGATRHEISGFEAENGFRFEIDGHVVDVLAPDGVGRAAMTDRQFRTIQIPGGSQALRRSETVAINPQGERTLLRRPTLLGAILLKGRSLRVCIGGRLISAAISSSCSAS